MVIQFSVFLNLHFNFNKSVETKILVFDSGCSKLQGFVVVCLCCYSSIDAPPTS